MESVMNRVRPIKWCALVTVTFVIALAASGCGSGMDAASEGVTDSSSGNEESTIADHAPTEESGMRNTAPKYYELADFIQADAQYMVNEIEQGQGLQYIETQYGAYWEGTPTDAIESIETNGSPIVDIDFYKGRGDSMTRDELLAGEKITAITIAYGDPSFSQDDAPAVVDAIVAECGLGDTYAKGDRAGIYYTSIGSATKGYVWDITVNENGSGTIPTGLSIAIRATDISGNIESYYNSLSNNGQNGLTRL